MVLVDAVHVTVCCVTYWTDMRIIPVTSECADVSLHNWAFYFVRSSHSSARSKNERSCTSTPSYDSQIYRAFHNVLQNTKIYYRKTVRHVRTNETCTDRGFCWTFRTVQTGPGAHPSSYTMGTGHFPGVERPGRGVDYPPHLAPKLKKE